VLPTNASSAGGDGGVRQACLEPSKSADDNSLASPAAQPAAPKRHYAPVRAVLVQRHALSERRDDLGAIVNVLRAAGERRKAGAP
jgi:hypothetical protein